MYGIEILILFTMYFLHIVDDFHLQGNLANFKQKIWWKENYPDKKYENDWIIALVLHGFSWTFMVLITPAIFLLVIGHFHLILFLCVFIVNWLVHIIVDNRKANKLKLNLIQDQLIHICQIAVSWLLLTIFI